MGELIARDDATDRVAEAVRHALRLVGPAERGRERLSDEAELPAA